MDFWYSLFFGAGVTAFLYTRVGRRVGYGNDQSVAVVMGVIFVISTLVFWTILRYVLHI